MLLERLSSVAATLVQAQSRPTGGPRPSLASIEQRYQVAEERTADWSPKLYGTVPLGGIGGTRRLTVTEGKLLDRLTHDRGIVGLSRFSGIADDAFATADRRSPQPALSRTAEAAIQRLPVEERAGAREQWPRNDGHNDAFRHAFWNARLTAEFGEGWTRQFTTAHEGNNPGSSTREAMDLYNNEVGRKIATDHPNASPAELADLVDRALRNGELVVIAANGHLAWSNQVAVGQHGVSIDLPGPARIPTPAGTARAAAGS